MHSSRIKFEKKLSYCLVVLLLFTFNCFAQISTKKIHPPYPDVWGYDMSEYPAMKWGTSGVDAYAMDDGDIWFVIDYSHKKSNPMDYLTDYTNEKYVLIKFFSGEQTILDAQQREKLSKITEDKIILSVASDHIEKQFSDGAKLKIHYGNRPKNCFIPDFYLDYYIKTDATGIEKKYSILAASPQVEVKIDKALCEAKGAPFLYKKLHVLTQFIPLNDDTFIVFNTGSNVILRFDKDFKTKFKPVTPVIINGNYIMRNFFVVDYDLIKKFHYQFITQDVPLYQSIHDALLLHFHEKYHE